MKPRQFVRQLDASRIEAAITAAEAKTSGEIRLVVHHTGVEDAVAFAEAEFVRLGMTQTRERNAVLLLVAPTSQTFAIVGDEGVHARCGAAFWEEIASTLGAGFRKGDFTGALVAGIARTGALLAEHFPRGPDDRDELPNEIVEH